MIGALGLVAAIIGSQIGGLIGREATKASLPTSSSSARLEENLATAVNQMRLTLPRQVDEVTLLTNVATSGRNFIYSYELKAGFYFTSPFEQRELIQRHGCQNMRLLVDRGVIVIYNYFSAPPESRLILSERITSCPG